MSHLNQTFSLIAQEENKISRSVAIDSAQIAVATKRDSSAMKTIALITILFLPSTFVAVSTAFGDKLLWMLLTVSIPPFLDLFQHDHDRLEPFIRIAPSNISVHMGILGHFHCIHGHRGGYLAYLVEDGGQEISGGDGEG
jgi:nitrate reductase NapE component